MTDLVTHGSNIMRLSKYQNMGHTKYIDCLISEQDPQPIPTVADHGQFEIRDTRSTPEPEMKLALVWISGAVLTSRSPECQLRVLS